MPLLIYRREILDVSSGFEEGSDELRWQLVLCLLLAWVIIFLCLIKGIKSSGKVCITHILTALVTYDVTWTNLILADFNCVIYMLRIVYSTVIVYLTLNTIFV